MAGSTAGADGVTHLRFDASALSGEVDRLVLEGGFDDQREIFGDIVYQSGAITAYGSFIDDRADFNANGRALGVDKQRLLELGLEYSFGNFAVGANVARNDFDTTDTTETFSDNELTTATLYGQYQQGGLIAGLGVFTIDIDRSGPRSNTEFDETDPILFASYEMNNGLLVGAGAFEIDGETFTYLFADYDMDGFGAKFYLVDDDNGTFAEVSGSYDVGPRFAIIGGLSNTNVKNGDGTTQRFVGGRYDVAERVSTEIAYHDIDAFNRFDGDAISVGVTYKIGCRKGGMQ